MSFYANKFIFTYLWLFATIFGFGFAQDDWHFPTSDNFHVSPRDPSTSTTNLRPISTTMPGLFRPRRPRPRVNVKTTSCLSPPQPVNGGRMLLDPYYCRNIRACKVTEAIALKPGTHLVYHCNPGYRIEGNTSVYCNTGGNWSSIPSCVEVTCDTLNSASTEMKSCKHFDTWKNCNSSVPSGTEAEVYCRPGYKRETTFVFSPSGMTRCNNNGKWEPKPTTCVPDCGRTGSHQESSTVGKSRAKVIDFPWHVSLFREINSKKTNRKVFVCGGTIIHANFVLTAAHCVYNERAKATVDPLKLLVITGNINRDYDSPMHDPRVVKTATVKTLHIHQNYYGLAGNYVSDIVLLELQHPFEFSRILLPACLDDSRYNSQFPETGAYGRVASFGRTKTNYASGILQSIMVPYEANSQCHTSKNTDGSMSFTTSDKFCTGYINGSTVCDDDTGGGLVFKKDDRWHVMGIVSIGLGVNIDNDVRTCNIHSSPLYTRVSVYTAWIQGILSSVKHKQSFPSNDRDSFAATSVIPPTTIQEPDILQRFAIDNPCPNWWEVPNGLNMTSSRPQGIPCWAPPQPENGARKLHRNFCKNGMDCSIPKATELPLGTHLVYSCDSGFTMRGKTDVYCRPGGVWTAIPICTANSCTLPNGDRGFCDLAENCPSVLKTLKITGSMGNSCGFSGAVPILCCPYIIPTTNTSSPLPPTKKIMANERGRIAKQKCTEYAEYVNTSKCPPFVTDNSVPTDVRNTLGKIKAKEMEFPYMAAVGFNLSDGSIGWYCDGTLISESYVLTSARCTRSPVVGDASWVRVGDLNLVRSNDGAMPEQHRVAEGFPHPDFRENQSYHDIGLLRLNSNLLFNGWVRPACLHTTPLEIQQATATGWLSLNWDDELYENDLMKVAFHLHDWQTCSTNSSSGNLLNGVIEDQSFCATAIGTDVCASDGGSPLVINSRTKQCMYDVIGIVNFGTRECTTGIPTLFTRIYYYVPWIESIVWNQLQSS